MRALAGICLDLTLLGQRAADQPLPDGHAYQRAVGDLLRRPGLRVVQQAGLTTLFGHASASGAPHEIDAAATAIAAAYLIEAKSRQAVGKADLAVFELKLTDFYFARSRTVAAHAWWPILASAAPVSESLRRLAAHRSVILCDPDRLPLPVLQHHVTHPACAWRLPHQFARDLRRLAPLATRTLQQRYRHDPRSGLLLLDPRPLSAGQIDALLDAQDELTDEILARYDERAPGRLERRAAQLVAALRRAA